MVGTVSAALVMAPILTLLLKAYGFAGHQSAKASPLIAAQANLMASVAKGVFGGGLPWTFILIGTALGVAVILVDCYQERRASTFRMPVLAVAIGIYLPFALSVPIFIGGILDQLLKRRRKKKGMENEAAKAGNRRGLLFASGLITGEAVVGILIAIPIVISARADVLAVLDKPMGAWPGVVLLIAMGYWLYRTESGKPKPPG